MLEAAHTYEQAHAARKGCARRARVGAQAKGEEA